MSDKEKEQHVDSETEVNESKAEETTAEDAREAEAQALTITMYTDGQITVQAVKNIANRSQTEFIISKAKSEFEKRDIATLTAMTILDTIAKSQKKKSIWVPGK